MHYYSLQAANDRFIRLVKPGSYCPLKSYRKTGPDPVLYLYLTSKRSEHVSWIS